MQLNKTLIRTRQKLDLSIDSLKKQQLFLSIKIW